ncbi:MAG: hypothetical protein E3J72_14545 [Planctomycetota bacterium]|nr:MAG: hypothetical protein E3J72_14545 [Planctomycetota bacterium]
MRTIRLLSVLCAVALVAGCSHLNGTFVSLAKYEKSGDGFYEILPGEAAFEWLPKLLKDLTPFDPADGDRKKALADKYTAYRKEVRASEGSGGGADIVRKYFEISLVFTHYEEQKVVWRDCYLFADEGIVRVLIEIKEDKPPTLGYYQPAPGLRGLIETLFTDKAQERYKEFSR